MNRTRTLAAAIALTSASLWTGIARAQTGDMVLDNAIAERFALLADEAVADPNAPEAVLREAAATLDLARLFKPREVRFARSSADVLLRLGERDRALVALTALRALDPKDQLAMIQFVDLTADKMETAEAKLAYLQQITDAVGIAAEVRSHAATLLMDLLFQRSQDEQGLAAMSTALSLNPQNIAALNVRYRVASESGVPAERAKALGDLLRAAPADANTMLGIAQECAAAGDYENAGFYYSMGLGVIANGGQTPPMDDFVDFAAVKMFAGETSLVEALCGQATQRQPNDGRLFSLQLLLAMMNGKTEADLTSSIQAARGVHLAQLAGVSQVLNKPDTKEMPATNPAAPYPDVRADAAKLAAPGGDPNNLRGAYTVALAEQIWFDAFYHAAPPDPASIEALRALVDPSDPLVVRLEGWQLLSAGKTDEAVVKLGAIADRDGYAKLGLVSAAVAKKDDAKAKELLTQLVTNRPSGLYGAHVAMQAKRQGIKVDMTPTEHQIAGLASSLRGGVENLLNNPRTGYLVSAKPLTISVPPGEPVLAELRLLNTGQVPITIGPGGLIGSRFCVDMTSRGDVPRNFPATVLGQWTGAVRLLPGQSVVQVVRVDRGRFGDFLRAYPTPHISMQGTVTTNPMPGERGSVPGAGGEQSPIGDTMERKPMPLHIPEFRAQLLEKLKTGNGAERVNTAEFIATVIPLLRTQPDNADAQDLAKKMIDALTAQISAEQMPAVKSWMNVASGTIAGAGPAQDATLDALAASDEPVGRTIGIWLAREAPADRRKAIAQRVLSANVDGPMKELAQGLADQPDLPKPPPPAAATTAPATTAP